MIQRLLRRLSSRLPYRMIHGGDPNDVYLERFYLFGHSPKYFDVPVRAFLGFLPFTVFLHHFKRSDADIELHNHPWKSAIAFILTGGYDEIRVDPDHAPGVLPIPTVIRRILPGHFNLIRVTDHHRVILLDPQKGCWTIFITGKN